MTKREREALNAKLAAAMAKNPGSPYVTVDVTRKQAEALVYAVSMTGLAQRASRNAR